jgi:hypothetical protein
MEEYKSNSDKSKTTESAPEKKVEKVIQGTVKTKKKNEIRKFTDVFISEDVSNVRSYILMDVLVPAIKKAVSDIIKDGIDMLLYGDSNGSRRRERDDIRPSYRKYYDDRDRSRSRERERVNVYSFDDIVLNNRGDAEDVLDNMLDIIEEYGTVSVADMYDLVGMSSNYTDNKYGWTDLRTAHVERERSGGYIIKLPRALPI